MSCIMDLDKIVKKVKVLRTWQDSLRFDLENHRKSPGASLSNTGSQTQY